MNEQEKQLYELLKQLASFDLRDIGEEIKESYVLVHNESNYYPDRAYMTEMKLLSKHVIERFKLRDRIAILKKRIAEMTELSKKFEHVYDNFEGYYRPLNDMILEMRSELSKKEEEYKEEGFTTYDY